MKIVDLFEHDEFENNNNPVTKEQRERKNKALQHHIATIDERMKDLILKSGREWDATGIQNKTSVNKKLTTVINPFDEYARYHITIKNLDPTSELGRKLLDLDRRRTLSFKALYANNR